MRNTAITLLGPVIRLFPPWWKARFYGRIVGDSFGKTGKSGRVRIRRVSPHQYRMELQLDDPMERFAFFVGCYWGMNITATVTQLLRRGDYFVDVGANLGFLTLAASSKVGSEGKVFAFEPSTAMADRLSKTLLDNKIGNVTVYQHALGDKEAEGMLDFNGHPSEANLRHSNGKGTKTRILRGDDVLKGLPESPWILAKLDVEGYELRVLNGFQSLIKRQKTAFLVEITDQWLRDLGGSADELFDLMLGNGFKAYLPKLTILSRLSLSPIGRPISEKTHYDVVFLRPEDDWLSR